MWPGEFRGSFEVASACNLIEAEQTENTDQQELSALEVYITN